MAAANVSKSKPARLSSTAAIAASWRAGLEELPPSTVLIVFIGAQILIWTAIPRLFAISLPLDVVSDGLSWGHEWQWGYFKHPPLPSWAVETFFDGLGDTGPFLLSQLAVGATYTLVFLLGREMIPARAALIATLLLAGVYYFSIPTPEFNHNVAQMPVWAWATYAYYKALQTGRLRFWAMLGLAAGIAVLTKYAAAVLFLAMFAYIISTRKTLAFLATPGPYVAFAVLLVVIAPHLVWLAQNHFLTFAYAEARAGHAEGVLARVAGPVKFFLSQLAAILPCLVVGFAIGLARPGRLSSFGDEIFRFLVFLGAGPVLITLLLSLATGFGLRDMWGAPMWNLTGLLLVYATPSRWPLVSATNLYAWVAALFVIMPVAYVISTSIAPEWRGKPSRTEWPDRAMAATFSAAWAADTHRPLKIIAADGWLGGLIAMRLSPRPSILIDGDFRHAPWIDGMRLRREGALVVWQAHGTDSPPPELDLPGMKRMGVKMFSWPRAPAVKPLRVGWAVLAPGVH